MLEFFDTLTLLLTMAAFIAGIIDSIAGGGGMITIPALLLAGIPPVEALGQTSCKVCLDRRPQQSLMPVRGT
jgi:uncharacterized membrane protein YfcA